MDDALKARVTHAVENLHADLARWLGSDTPAAVFERVMDTQHPDFTMVTQSGEIVTRSQLAEGLRRSGNAVPGLTIDIEDLAIIASTSDVVVVRFTEGHRHEGHLSRRVTTAILTVDVSTEEGLRWLSVHETASVATG